MSRVFLRPESRRNLTRQHRSAALSRSPRRYPTELPNLLTGLWLKDAPSTCSFCNLEAHPITAYSQWDRVLSGFRPLACIEVLEGSDIHRAMTVRSQFGKAPSGFALILFAIAAVLGLSASACAQTS